MPRPNGTAIKAARQEQGWKAYKLAAAVGISRPHLSNIEGGRADRYASVEVLHRLAYLLGKPYAELVIDADQHLCTCRRAV